MASFCDYQVTVAEIEERSGLTLWGGIAGRCSGSFEGQAGPPARENRMSDGNCAALKRIADVVVFGLVSKAACSAHHAVGKNDFVQTDPPLRVGGL